MAISDNTGKPQTRAKNKYNAKKYDSLRIVVKKGGKDIISEYASSNGKSINGLVNELLEAEVPGLKDLKK